MNAENLIAIEELCISHDIEISFVSSLQNNGLIQVITVEDRTFIEVEQVPEVEKFIRLYYDLDINVEGIETITHLLGKIHNLQNEVNSLKNRLDLYE